MPFALLRISGEVPEHNEHPTPTPPIYTKEGPANS